MAEFLNAFTEALGGKTLDMITAMLILAGGWLAAFTVALIVRKAISRSGLDDRVAKWTGRDEQKNVPLSLCVYRIIYYSLLFFVVVAFFKTLGFTAVTEPLNVILSKIFAYLPNLLGAALLVAVAWLLATILRFVILKVISTVKLDQNLKGTGAIKEGEAPAISHTLAGVFYWLVYLLFLPAVLHTLGLTGQVLMPLQRMLEQLLGYLPNVFGAAVILAIGWIFARIIRQIVVNLLSNLGANKFSEKLGLKKLLGGENLAKLSGTIVYALILIPVIIAGLQALQIKAISDPAVEMLSTLLNSVPSIFAATVVLGVTYVIARLIAGLVTNILAGVGFDKVFTKLGFKKATFEGAAPLTPSSVVGTLALIALMLFASIEAASLLGFNKVAELVATFLAFGGQILLGLVIFGVGLYLGGLAYKLILGTAGEGGKIFAQVSRLTIVVLSAAMGVRQMGIAEDIVNMAFAFFVGAIAVAAAIAFGFGAKDIAAKEVESWLSRLRSKSKG